MAQVKQVTAEGLHWVREEIGGALERVRGFVEDYLEAPANPLPLQRSLVELHQIRGTLRMIQCDGAALMAEEMKAAVQDLLNDGEAPEKAFEVLLGATLQLTDYLDVLAGGESDNALVFLPLINELRVARGAGVLSESVLFARYAQLELPDAGGVADDETVHRLAKRQAPAFNTALLRILKDQASTEHLESMYGIAEAMEKAAGDTRDGRLFGAAAALLEALRDRGAVAAGLEIKRLLGRVGQRLRELGGSGSEAYAEAPAEVLYGLVYFAGGAASAGERVSALRRDYRLDELLPDALTLERMQGRMRGPNTGLVTRLSTAIKEDIQSVKSSIDLVVRAGDRAAVRLEDTIATTRRVGDTLEMLGLDMLRHVVLNQARAIEELAVSGVRDQEAWMDVALALLRVEESLDGALLRHVQGQEEDFDPEAPAQPHQEIGTGAAAVYREALINLSRVKTLIPDFIDVGEPALLAEIARLLREVEAGLQVLERDDGRDLVSRLRAYVSSHGMLGVRSRPSQMRALADAVAGVEYYLEALQSGQARPRSAYAEAAAYVERLGPVSEDELIDVEEPEKVSGTPGETADPEEVDPEIREVFLEEAAEVLETLERDVPAWSGNLDDAGRLTGIRRAFHTLKGSGRMAGAGDIGEFGWALERMLNRCMEGAVEAGAEVAATVQKAVNALPGLVEDFRAGRAPTGITPIVAEANRLAGVTGEGGGEDRPAEYAESELFRVFRSDARGHIAHLREAAQAASEEPVADETVRALHTLKGSAEAVHLHEVARLARVLEQYADICNAAQRPFSTEDPALLGEAAAAFEAVIAALEDGAEPDVETIDALVARVEAAKAELPEEVVESASERALRMVFANEACDLVDELQAGLIDWGRNPGDAHYPQALKGVCHTLKGSARTVEAQELGEAAQALEQRVADYLAAGAAPPDDAAFEQLGEVVDGLYEMLDGFRRSGRTGEAAPVLALLEAMPKAASEPKAPAAAPREEIDPELLATFRGEAGELMEAFEAELDRWAENPDDAAPREALMRTLHTLKGSARMAQLEVIGDISHALETRIAAVEDAGTDLIERLRRAADGIHRLLDALDRGESAPPADAILTGLEPEAEGETETETETAAESESEAEPEPEPEPEEEAPVAGEPEEALDIPVPTTFDERLYWQPGTEAEEPRRGRPETARVPVARLDEMLNEAGEISIFRARLAQQNVDLQFQLREMLQTASRLREQLRKLDMETEAQILARHEPSADRYDAEFDPLEMDRYSALHELSRGLAESATDLISLHGSMTELAERDESLLVQQSRVNTSLQQGLMRTLMVPFSRQSQRLQRLVRQVGEEYGREVRLNLEGIEAELDRNVLERMVAPLEHLLRNAVVHGIEPPDERAGRGKPEAGTIGVRLFREGTQLVVEVGDDGRGLDFEAIRAKAEELGLLDADAGLADADLAQFIFEPGFSTARELTRTAGRGVGMDAVNAEIKQLGGTLTVDSAAGEGTRFTVRLPLTLAISQALLVQVGDERYALPLGSIQGVTRIPRVELDRHLNAVDPSFEYGGQQYRVRSLAALLNVPETRGGLDDDGPANIPVLLVRAGERYTAFTVDGMLGSREIVVKPVGPQVATVPAVAGATIMADGEVVLILDVAALMQMQVRRAMRESEPAEPAEVVAMHDERPLVMVVDDSITIRRVSERFLSRHGFAVVTAKDGMDALAKLQVRPPQVVLLDIEMPRIDGYELATYMRNSDTLYQIPIIMVTSRSGDKHRRRAEAIGVERFVTKPYQEQDLLAQIHAVLRPGGREAPDE